MPMIGHPEVRRSLYRYAVAVAAVAIAFALRQGLVHLAGPQFSLYPTLYPAVMLVALVGGFWPGVLATGLSAALSLFAMLTAHGAGPGPGLATGVDILTFCASGLLISAVAGRYRQSQRKLAELAQFAALRETQGQLRVAESQFETLANHIPQLCWMADADGVPFWYNAGWYEYTGMPPGKIWSGHQTNIVGPDALPLVLERWNAALANGTPFEIVFPLVGRDGVSRQFLTRVLPLRNEQGEVTRWFGTNTDIDEQKRSEAALRSAKERLALAIEVAGIGEWEVDLKSDTGWHSQRHAEIYGYPAPLANWSLRTWFTHLPPSSVLEVREFLQSGQTAGLWEMQILGADGEERFTSSRVRILMDETGQPSRLVGTTTEITDRKRAENALKQSELRLRLFAENAPAAIAMFDRQMRYLMVSERWKQDFGVGGVDLLGLSHYEQCPQMLDEWRESHRRALAGETVKSESMVEASDGTKAWNRWEVRPWYAPDGSIGGVVLFTEDTTERVLAERHIQRLTRIQAVLSDINKTIVRERDPQGMLEAACQIAVEKGQFRMAWVGMLDPESRKVKAIAEAGVMEGYLDSIPLDLSDEQTALGPGAKCLRSGRHMICNDIDGDPQFAPWREAALSRGYRSMGVLPIALDGKAVGIFCLYASEAGFFDDEELVLLDEMAMDISFALEVIRNDEARRKTEEALRARTAFFEAQMESSLDGIAVRDVNKKVIFQNSQFRRLWKMSESVANDHEWPHRVAYAVSQVKDVDPFLRNTNLIDANPDAVSEDEVELLDGTLLTRFTAPVKDVAGTLYGRIWVFRDMTQRRKLELQLRQTHKMEAVGQLTGGIAHDFNNLLAVVLGNLDLLDMSIPAEEVAKGRLQIAQKAAERGADLTRRLLAFSKDQDLRAAPNDLGERIDTVLELARTLGPNIKFIRQLDESVPAVLVDGAGLENAILNLLVNARDAMPGGGPVTIATQLCALDASDPVVQTGEMPVGTYARLSVTDTGHGMSKETLGRVFEPFFTTKLQGRGTGLGLAMVYGFVKQSGGAVKIHSQVGLGTTVTLFLPLAKTVVDKVLPAPAIPVENYEGKVLVVDDEPELIEVLLTYLERMGYTTYSANDAEGALALAGRHRDIDLLITDIVMPGGMNGVELARTMRELLPQIRVIYSSGFPANVLTDSGVPRIEGMMLHKPYRAAEFEAAVRASMA